MPTSKNDNQKVIKSYTEHLYPDLVSVQHQREMQCVIKAHGRKWIHADKAIFIPSQGESTRSYCFKSF